jgi:alkylation response protein AidB-like acyl-CoA dehydrogenase
MDISANGAVTLTLDGLQIPNQGILGVPGGALTLSAEEAPKAWIRSGARYVGMVSRLIEMSLEHARDWISLGEALVVRPAIQRMLAEMRVDAASSRWLTLHAAWMADAEVAEDLHSTAAEVRLATGEMLKRAVDRVTMIFAGPGPSPTIEPQRFVRSLAPPEALDMALEQARAVILADMLGSRSS